MKKYLIFIFLFAVSFNLSSFEKKITPDLAILQILSYPQSYANDHRVWQDELFEPFFSQSSFYEIMFWVSRVKTDQKITLAKQILIMLKKYNLIKDFLQLDLILSLMESNTYEQSDFIMEIMPMIMDLNPRVEDIIKISLKYKSPNDFIMPMFLKNNMFEYNLIKNTQDYIEIFKHDSMKEQDIQDISSLIVHTFDVFLSFNPSLENIYEFISKDYLTIKDANEFISIKIFSYLEQLNIEDFKTVFDESKYLGKKYGLFNYFVKFIFYKKFNHELTADQIYSIFNNVNEVDENINNLALYILSTENEKEVSLYRLKTLIKIIENYTFDTMTKPFILISLDQMVDSYDEKNQHQTILKLKNELGEHLNDPKLIQRKNINEGSCSVCFEDYLDSTICECPYEKCNFRLCIDCSHDSIITQMKNNNYPLHCDNCKKAVSVELNQLSDKSLWNLYEKNTILYYHQKKFPTSKNCPTPNCSNRIIENDIKDENHYECTTCGYSYCFDCQVNHKNKSCESEKHAKIQEEKFHKLIHDPSSNIRPCPYCLVPTEKKDACDHITCTKCHQKWDWKFGKKIGPIHYSKTDGSEPRVYRVEGEL